MPKTFIEIASDAVHRGLVVVPLRERTKVAVEKDWQSKGYVEEIDLLQWNGENENFNCGALCSKDTNWIFDVDQMEWFVDNFPKDLIPALDTFAVKTGGGGLQFHFKHDDLSRELLSNKSIPNPNKDKYCRADGSVKDAVADILYDRKQGLLPGCVHPVTGKDYEVYKDRPLACAEERLVRWLAQQVQRQSFAPVAKEDGKSPFRLRKDVDVEKLLTDAGLKYKKFEADGKVYFNYHEAHGKCLVKGESHAAENERPNDRQSSFVWDRKQGHLWHQCFSASCPPGIVSTKRALAALGVDWRAVFAADGLVTVVPVRFSDMKKEHIKYLWPRYLPLNKLVHVAGNSTEGKSPVTVDLASRVSAGLAWPCGSNNEIGPGKVILLAAEDDPTDTVLPRLELMGADTANVLTLRATITKGMTDAEKGLAFDTDMAYLLDAMHAIPDLRLVVIDPITNYLGKLNMNKEEEVRSVLMPLAIAAKDLDCCIVTVGHLNKKSDASPKQRIMGAAAFHGVARFLYLCGPDPEDPDKWAHVFVQDRGVGAETLRYATEAVKMEWDGAASDVVRVRWRGISTATGEDAVNPDSQKSKVEEKDAAKILLEFLKTGRKTAQECAEHMRGAGFMLDMGDGKGINAGRLRKKIKAKAEQKEKKWWWLLPSGPENGDLF